MGFIDLLNFILICLLILSIILLYLRQNRLIELEKKYEQLNRELEDSIASFFTRLQEENEAFLSNFKQVQQELEKNQKNDTKIPPTFSTIESIDEIEQIEKNQAQFVSKKSALHAYQKVQGQSEIEEVMIGQQDEKLNIHQKEQKNNQKETNEVNIEKINAMLRSGISYEAIAKEMNLGVTELELLVKFQQKSN